MANNPYSSNPELETKDTYVQKPVGKYSLLVAVPVEYSGICFDFQFVYNAKIRFPCFVFSLFN